MVTSKVTQKTGQKVGQRVAQRAVKKGLSRFIPGLGTVMGVKDAVSRVKKGDYVGAALSGASAIPGPLGWAATAADIARDVTKAKPQTKTLTKPETKTTTITKPETKTTTITKPETKTITKPEKKTQTQQKNKTKIKNPKKRIPRKPRNFRLPSVGGSISGGTTRALGGHISKARDPNESFEMVCDFLIQEGYAETGPQAEAMYNHMSAEWMEFIHEQF